MDYVRLRALSDQRLRKMWEVSRKVREEAEMLCLLSLAYYVRAAYPDAIRILLEESGEDFASMTFLSASGADGTSYEEDPSETPTGEPFTSDDLWSYASSLDPRNIVQWAFWKSTGGRHNTIGYLKIDELIEYVGQHVQPIDPMPDPADLQAVETWLAEESV